jgi:hypothetical protein
MVGSSARNLFYYPFDTKKVEKVVSKNINCMSRG